MRLRTDGVTWQEIDGELVILDLDGSVYLTTNKSGAVLTKALVAERTADDLAALLVTEFGITEEQALADAEAFTGLLREHGLLA